MQWPEQQNKKNMKIIILYVDYIIFFSFFQLFIEDIVINKKNVSRIRKKTFYLQFCMGTNLQAESKILKYWNIKSTNQNEKFSKKSMFGTLKV
jgi:hypothetical protein